jgi:hypothetical protein
VKCSAERGPHGRPSLPSVYQGGDMTQASNQGATQSHMGGDTMPPTQPGVYWFQPETMPRALMVEVRMMNGQLMVWWPNQDEPVANLKGHWRGPIRPSSGPGSR